MRTRVKICGITNEPDLMAAVNAGADAVGFNMWHGSKRCVTVEMAESLTRCLPPYVTSVGLFVNPGAEEVRTTLDRVGFDVLQFHGDESDEFCAGFSRPYMKALAVDEETDIAAVAATFPGAIGILLDVRVNGQFGGTGVSFDWTLVGTRPSPHVLAGGLDPLNVGAAIARVRPYAVDVSSGVESEKRKKDHNKIRAFMQAVARADKEYS